LNTNVLDRFTDTFSRYIDSGFGLLAGEVAWLAATLIVIDIVLAGLFWAWGVDEDILARLVKKTLFVGVFAFLINNWNWLARIVFESFGGLGLMAGGSAITPQQLLQPGRIAQVGIDAGQPILQAVGQLIGFVGIFANAIQIIVLMLTWLVVLLAFFIIAIQLFVTLIEFKLTTLAGFVLVPFGLFGKTAFLAERVLGNVVASGVKVLVLAVIIGIGSTLFTEFTRGFGGRQPTIDDALGLMLAALALLGLAIFGPGIATGLVSGAPQLGAGAAVGTGLAAGGALVAGIGATRIAAGAAVGAGRAAYATGSGAAAAYRSGAAASGATGLSRAAAGAGTVARAGAAAVGERVAGAFRGSGSSAPPDNAPPAWARRMQRRQSLQHGATMTAHAVRSGDHGGGSASIPLSPDRP
jgi:type IV secretion system protein TrbL